MNKINEAIKIDGIRLYETDIPYVIPFRISGGVNPTRKSLIIEMHADGMVSWGETSPFELPFYSSETVSSTKVIIMEVLLPRIVGRSFTNIEDINRVLRENVRGNPFARASIETAYWDMVARKNKAPLKAVIQQKLVEYGTTEKYLVCKDYIESGVSVGIPEDLNYKTLAKWVEGYANDGYRRIKLKVRPGWDLQAAKTGREVVGYDMPMWVDANSSFDLDEHLDILKGFDAYDLCFLEQPLDHDDLFYHGKLGRMIKTPVCLDESLKSLANARQCVEGGISRIWNIKVHRTGGLLEAVRIYAYASQHDIKVWGGTMPESGVGSMAIANLACFGGFAYPTDIEDSARWFGRGNDLIEIKMDRNGRISMDSKEPGIGEINMDNFKRYSKLVMESGAF